jgi:hypothetical protein
MMPVAVFTVIPAGKPVCPPAVVTPYSVYVPLPPDATMAQPAKFTPASCVAPVKARLSAPTEPLLAGYFETILSIGYPLKVKDAPGVVPDVQVVVPSLKGSAA